MPVRSTADNKRASNPYQEGIDYMRRGEYARAAAVLEQARRRTPDNVGVLYKLGLAYYNMEKFDEAMELWKRAAKNLPDRDLM